MVSKGILNEPEGFSVLPGGAGSDSSCDLLNFAVREFVLWVLFLTEIFPYVG